MPSRWSVRTVFGQRSDASCCQDYNVSIHQTFFGQGIAVGWNVTVTSAAALPWRTSLNTSVTTPINNFWVPRVGVDASTKDGLWDDVTRMLTPDDAPRYTQYGTGFMDEADVFPGEIMPVPATVSASLADDAAIGFFQSVADNLFLLNANVGPAGVTFMRQANRLGQGRVVSFTIYFVPLAGSDWRPLFAWARTHTLRVTLQY